MFFEQTDGPRIGKSVATFNVDAHVIGALYSGATVGVDDLPVYNNQPLVLKAGSQSVLALVSRDGQYIKKATEITNFGIKGRNKEQILLQNILQDPEIRCVVITGRAGSGKTVCIGSYALDQILDKKNFKKIIISKPMEIVTTSRFWGALPGNTEEKYSAYLKSFEIFLENVSADKYVSAAKTKCIEFMPLELMRGVTLRDSIVWYDEAQNLNHHEMVTLGSRIDDVGGTKLIISGDMDQIDHRMLKKHNTGMMKLLKSPVFLNSPYCAHIELIQNERGVISRVFSEVFEDEEE